MSPKGRPEGELPRSAQREGNPVSDEPFSLTPSAGTRPGADAAYAALRYLVVEDQEASRQTLRLCLQTMGGVSIDVAHNHGDALFRIRNRTPDVVVCDYILGEGRTGQQLLEELRRAGSLPERVLFIMVTAERGYEKVISALELVPDDYIIKPFSPEVLRGRLEKVIQKKRAFMDCYTHREAKEWPQAIEALDAMLRVPAYANYRYDILRNRAATLADADRIEEAAAAYEAILAEYPFPWAKTGLARMRNQAARYDEARALAEDVIAQVPTYFEAYDLKATICTHQGDFATAQATLADAARRTPYNYVRKKSLSAAAARNGDFDLAREMMDEVVARDVIGDHGSAYLDLARSALDAGRADMAQAMLVQAAPHRDATPDSETRLCMECMAAVLEGDAGQTRFDRVRAEIARHRPFSVKAAIDVARAALHFSDVQLANAIAEKTLLGSAAREAFAELLGVYRQHGLEQPFRELQKEIVARRLARKGGHG